MIRGLTVVALGGALLSVVCIGLSGAMTPHHWHIPSVGWHMDVNDDEGDGPSLNLTGHEPIISRDLAWAGGQTLTFDVPARVTYTQGPVAKITLSGPDALVNHVVLEGDTLKLDRTVHGMDTDHALTMTITGPAVHEFEVNSAAKLSLNNLNVDALSVQIDGAGKVDAQGTAKSVHLEINGAADADLGALTVADAHVEIDGIGHVIAAPTGDAHVEINGAGKVALTKRPAHLDQEINGAGSITQPDAPAGQSL
jgi:hypothetical protein